MTKVIKKLAFGLGILCRENSFVNWKGLTAMYNILFLTDFTALRCNKTGLGQIQQVINILDFTASYKPYIL